MDELAHYYFSGRGTTMAYTLCWKPPCGPLAVRHTPRAEEVTCPTCQKIMGWKRPTMLELFDLEHPVIAMGSGEWTQRQKLMSKQGGHGG